MKIFTATSFQRNPADIFNATQSNGFSIIHSKSRPNMVLMLESEQNALVEKIRQLTETIERANGDKKDQLDLLSGD